MAIASRSSNHELKSSPLPKLCVVCNTGRLHLFIVDLNYDGCSAEKRIGKIHTGEFTGFTFHAVESTIYMFHSAHENNCVYSYEVPKDILDLPSQLDKTMVKKYPPLLCPKFSPEAIGYRKGMLVFSTQICFSNCGQGNSSQIDFELYDPKAKAKSKNLPPLLVRLTDQACYYEFVDRKSGSCVLIKGKEVKSGDTFDIDGYGLMDSDMFVVQTNLGHSFKIDLQTPGSEWELCGCGGMFSHSSQFFVMENRFCLDAYGAYDMKTLDNRFYFNESEAALSIWNFNAHELIPLPLPLAAAAAVRVQVGLDDSDDSYLLVDLLEFDFSKFPKSQEQEQEWAKRIKSSMFLIKDEYRNEFCPIPHLLLYKAFAL